MPQHDAWVRRIVDAAMSKGMQPHDLVIVIDNAPSHNGLETREIGEDLQAMGVTFLRLGPYSAPLNPIELIWNNIKCHIKNQIASSLATITNVPENRTQAAHRFELMVRWANEGFALVTTNNISRACIHCSNLFVACANKQPLLG